MSNFDYKLLTQQELDRIFSGVHFKVQPRWHQLVSLAFAIERDNHRVMFLHGVGTGKTLCALFTAQLWNCKKILVICPSSAFGAWERDIPFGTDYSYTFLVGTKNERLMRLDEGKNVNIINYEGLKVIYGNLVNKGWRIDYTSFVHDFDCIIIDEAHRCNNYKSLQTKICHELSKRARCVVGMTGTVIDKTMLELFNTYRVVDLGASLGVNFFRYRNMYFYPAGYDWRLKPRAKEKILNCISRTTISFDRDECIDLPELQEIEITVEPTREFLDLQELIMKGLPIHVDDIEVENENESVRAHRLRELSGGFFYYDDNGGRKSHVLLENPKLAALLDFIKDSGSKILVFYWFEAEKILIENALKSNKIQYVSICSGQDPMERKEAVTKFAQNSSIQIMTAQSRISEGYDATVADTVVFYLPLGSPRMRTQCVGRIHRSGQSKKCLVVDLVLRSSIDKRIILDRGERFDLVRSFKKYLQDYYQEDSEV